MKIEYINHIYNCNFLEIIDEIPNGVFALLILDFPYNLKKDFPNDNLTPKDFRALLRKWVKLIIPKLDENGSLYIFMGYDFFDYLKLLLKKYLIFKREIIWHYVDGGDILDTKNYLPEFDKILYFVKSNNYTFNKIRRKPSKYSLERWRDHCNEKGIIRWEKLSKDQKKRWKSKEEYLQKGGFNLFKGKPLGNVLIIPKVNNLSKERLRTDKGKTLHPSQKPEALIKQLIEVSTNEGDLVGDLVMGTGTTCAVAKKLRRKWFGTEIREDFFLKAQERINAINVFQNITQF